MSVPSNNPISINSLQSITDQSSLRWAAIQMLEHWQRCGCNQIQMGVESASTDWLGVSASPSPEPVYSRQAHKPALQPIPIQGQPLVKPSLVDDPKTGSVEPSNWMTNEYSIEDRLSRIELLKENVQTCQMCPELVCSRKQTVFGIGNIKPRVVFFGEAPGADEDRLGEPFVGAAGQLLNKILIASKMKREEVYILNSLKCRPPSNRTPTDSEIENCRPFFESQLELLRPEFIVCLGAIAVRSILKTTEPVGRLRGRFHRFRGAQVLVTYHPAYLLRNEDAKRLTWTDMQLLMKAMGQSLK